MIEAELVAAGDVLAALEAGETHLLERLSLPARACLSMAYYDLISREKKASLSTVFEVDEAPGGPAVATLGAGPMTTMKERLEALPEVPVLKVKWSGAADALDQLQRLVEWDPRPILLDANRAMRSVEMVQDLLAAMPAERIIGLEQPFDVGSPLQFELEQTISVTTYADESIQGEADLDAMVGQFGGVNLKLVKCGGPDKAARMAIRARQAGLKVMLGNMSETSLGCGAMCHLAGYADLVDLDGPWLIRNDPFKGMGIRQGRYVVHGTQGIGVDLIASLAWTPIGA